MATKTHVQVSYDLDSASDTTYDEDSAQEEDAANDLEMENDAAKEDRPEEASDTSDESGDDEGVEDASDASHMSGDDEGNAVGGGAEDDGSLEDDDEQDADAEDGDDSEDEEADNAESQAQSGLANVMADILKKKTKDKKPVILSKAKTDREIQWKKRQAELSAEAEKDAVLKKKKIDTDISDEPQKSKFEQERERILKRKLWEEKCHVKPSVLNRDVERKLQRIATRGVVQLFNAVKKQQKLIEDKLKEVGSSERKRDNVMKSMTKGAFLDMLKGGNTGNVSAEPTKEIEDRLKRKSTEDGGDSSEDEDAKQQPSWSVLRDDFMMGAKMKDWDKKDDDDSDGDDDMDGDNPGGGGGGEDELDSDSD